MDQRSIHPGAEIRGNTPWSLIPVLTFAGFVSAIFSTFIRFSALISIPNDSVFAVMGSLSFALAVGSVLWFYRLVRKWRTLGAVVVVTVAVHLLELYAELHLPIRLREYVDIPVLGSIEPRVAVMSFTVVLILSVALLMLTTPRAKLAWAFLIALLCALLAAATIAGVDGTQQGAWISFWRGNALELLWQLTLAFVFAIALTLKGAISPFHMPAPQPSPKVSFKRRIAAFGVLLCYFVVAGVWGYSVATRGRKRKAELMASLETEATKKVAEAPSFDNLPPLTPRPFDEALVWDHIGDWVPSSPGSYISPSVRTGRAGILPGLPAPERKTYYVRYSELGNAFEVQANVTVYPNEAWARYEVSIPPTTRQTRGIQKLQRFGNNIYQEGPYFFWSSGDKVVRLECQGVLPDVIDEFLKAYLQKFPSSE